MLTIDVPNRLNGITIDDNDAVSVRIIEEGDSDNWGDDDCIKMVTILYACEIRIKKAYAELFKNISRINMYRRGYYNPAYCIDDKSQDKYYAENGDLIFRTRERL